MDADVNVVRVWIESTHLEPAHRTKNPEQYEEAWRILRSVQGILIPGGFGDRGVEGLFWHSPCTACFSIERV